MSFTNIKIFFKKRRVTLAQKVKYIHTMYLTKSHHPKKPPHTLLAKLYQVLLTQPGTWDPLLQCLHLNKHLLEHQNTKTL